jgi:hypothetical protein
MSEQRIIVDYVVFEVACLAYTPNDTTPSMCRSSASTPE